MLRERPWNVIVFFIPAFYFSIWNFWFVFFFFGEKGEFSLKQSSSLFSFFFGSHPSIIRCVWDFSSTGHKNKTSLIPSPESENARVLSYYIQQCESAAALGLFCLCVCVWNDRDNVQQRNTIWVWSLFLFSPLDRKLTFSLFSVPSFGFFFRWMIAP